MSGSTVELALATAVDADDLADYLTISDRQNIITLDALFNNTTGHNHSGAHQGGPISSIPIGAIPDGSITSAKIADGSISTVDLADNSVTTAKLAPLAAHQVMAAAGTINFTTSSTSYVDVPGWTITMTTLGGHCIGWVSGPAHVTSGGVAGFNPDLDGSLLPAWASVFTLTQSTPMAFVVDFGFPAAGTHTFKIRTVVNSTSVTLNMFFSSAAVGQFIVAEMRKA